VLLGGEGEEHIQYSKLFLQFISFKDCTNQQNSDWKTCVVFYRMLCKYIKTLHVSTCNTNNMTLENVPDSSWLLCGVVCGHSWQLHVVKHPYPAAAVQHSGDHSDLQHAVVSLHSETQFGINNACKRQCFKPNWISRHFMLAIKCKFQNKKQKLLQNTRKQTILIHF
jgi:hypothetical protein